MRSNVRCRTIADDGFAGPTVHKSTTRCRARRLEDTGCAAVMLLGPPIGTGPWHANPHNIDDRRRGARVLCWTRASVPPACRVAMAGCDAARWLRGDSWPPTHEAMAAAMAAR